MEDEAVCWHPLVTVPTSKHTGAFVTTITMYQMERERGALISQTFKELNCQYNNSSGSSSGSHRRAQHHVGQVRI